MISAAGSRRDGFRRVYRGAAEVAGLADPAQRGQLDEVTAGRLFKRDHKKKFNIKVEGDIDQKNVAYEKTNACGDDISGKSKNCAVLIGSTNNAWQLNEVEF